MKPISIPVRGLMHDPTDAVEYMPMPREMTTFEMPRVPDPGPGTDIAGARDVLQVFLDHMSRWLNTGGELPALDLALTWRDNIGAFGYRASLVGSSIDNEVLRLSNGEEQFFAGGLGLGGQLGTRQKNDRLGQKTQDPLADQLRNHLVWQQRKGV